MRWFPLKGWTHQLILPGKLDAAGPWTDRTGRQVLPSTQAYPLPPGWHWITPWKVDLARGRQGAQHPVAEGSSSSPSESSSEPSSTSSSSAESKAVAVVDKHGWEFALTFQDSWGKSNPATVVRRRKWIRTMVRYGVEQP